MEPYGFLFRVPAQFGLCVDVVLLDTEFEVIPFFAATAIFRIFGIKAGSSCDLTGSCANLATAFFKVSRSSEVV